MPKGVHNSPRGPKSRYDPACLERVTNFCLLGLTEERIAELLGIDHSNLIKWRHKYPELQQAFDNGRDDADAKVSKALLQRALGYTYKAQKPFFNHKTGAITIVEYEQHVPASEVAIQFYLANRARAQWKRDPDTQVNVNLDLRQLILDSMTIEEEDKAKALEHKPAGADLAPAK